MFSPLRIQVGPGARQVSPRRVRVGPGERLRQQRRMVRVTYCHACVDDMSSRDWLVGDVSSYYYLINWTGWLDEMRGSICNSTRVICNSTRVIVVTVLGRGDPQ